MALEYFKYITTYGNTIVDRSNTSFSPVPPYGQIHIDYFIPDTQPLYLYRNVGGSGGTIVVNTQENIDAYLGASELPPTSDGNVTYGEFTGTTTALSATTTALQTNKLDVSGGTMQGKIHFSIPSTDTNFGSIGKNDLYSGLDINGLAGLSLTTPYLINPQWSAYTGSYLTLGTNGLITFTTPQTGATSWQVTGGTNSIVANIPEDLGFIVTVTSEISMGSIEWDLSFTNSTSQSANVQLQLVVNGTPSAEGVYYVVAKNATSKLFGSAPVPTPIASGTTFDIRITSDRNGVVNRSLLKISKSGSAGGGAAVWGGITGDILTQTDLQNQFNTKLNTSIYQTYTGTTAPATYLTKSAFNIYSGTTVPANYYNKSQINSYSASTLTNINSRLLTATFNTYTGTTEPTIYLKKTTFATYTGTTVPNTYYNKTQINSYTASTLTNINSRLLTSIYQNYTGTTAPATYLTKSAFSTYSGTTIPNTYYNKTQINSYSASTLTNINSRLLTTIYSNYTGTTVPNTYYNKTQINSYTGKTATAIGLKLDKTTFATYTGTTAPAAFASKVNAITGATNLGSGNAIYTSVSGNKIQLKSISGGSGISVSNTANVITISDISSGSGNYFYSECLTNRTTTSTTCVKAHGLTGTTNAGVYEVDIVAQYGNATSNACTMLLMKIDNVNQGGTLFGRTQGAGWLASASLMRDVTLTATSHCIDIWFWNASGTACVPISTIKLKRIC